MSIKQPTENNNILAARYAAPCSWIARTGDLISVMMLGEFSAARGPVMPNLDATSPAQARASGLPGASTGEYEQSAYRVVSLNTTP